MSYLVFALALCFPHGLAGGDPITTVSIWPLRVFPVELGETVTWKVTPKRGAEYHSDAVISVDVGNQRAYRVQKTSCVGPFEMYFKCAHLPQNEIEINFTPIAEHYGQEILITYYQDLDSLWSLKGLVLLRDRVQLTKQPSFVEMTMMLKDPSRHTFNVPTALNLRPPVFLTGSNVRIECVSDGALPPIPIAFSIECPPPPTALVELDRVRQAKQNLPYERFYHTYGFRSPPTLSDLAPYVARKHADHLLRVGHVFVGKDNKTLRATLSITEIAHDCHVVCRLAGKETRRRMTVYYPTTTAYLLPRPRDGYVNVGSEITCHADGYPPPTLSLRLSQPLRPRKPLSPEEIEALRKGGLIPRDNEITDVISKEMMLAQTGLDIIPQQLNPPGLNEAKESEPVASSGTLHQVPVGTHDGWFNGLEKEPYEEASRIPGSGLSAVPPHGQLGLNPNEYSIQGATFRLAPNATPGVELMLTCLARNTLPGDTSFLSLNGTVTRMRFVVAAISYESLAVALGVCACVLLILVIIIVAMLLQKRRQGASGGDTDRLTANGTKKVRTPYTRDQYTKVQVTTDSNPEQILRITQC